MLVFGRKSLQNVVVKIDDDDFRRKKVFEDFDDDFVERRRGSLSAVVVVVVTIVVVVVANDARGDDKAWFWRVQSALNVLTKANKKRGLFLPPQKKDPSAFRVFIFRVSY